MASRTQIRLQQLTGSIPGSGESAAASTALVLTDLKGTLDHMASAIKRTHGAATWSANTAGQFDQDLVVAGTTPKITIGDAGAEDTMLVFDGNATDYRIGLDDGTDKLEIGVNAAHGTTTAITVDTAQQVVVVAGTEATSATDGALAVTGGASVAKDIVVGDDLILLSDSSVIHFGAGKDITLTHTNDTGLTMGGSHANGTNLKIDNSAGDGDSRVEFQLGGTTVWSVGVEDGDSDKFVIEDAAGVLGADPAFEIAADKSAKFFGTLEATTSITIGSAAMSEADLEKLDGITDGTAAANKAVVLDGSKNIATIGTVGCGAITSTGNSAMAQLTTSGRVILDDATEATTTTDGSLQTDGGLSVAKSAVVGIDLDMLKDGGIINFGADKEVTLTHVHNSGLLLSDDSGIGTTKLMFGDAATYIQQPADGYLRVAADTAVQILSDTFSMDSANTLDPLVVIKNTTNDANGSRLQFTKDKGAAGADNDILGTISWVGDNDAQEQTSFADIMVQIADASNGTEGGKLSLRVASHDGGMEPGIVIADGDADGEVDITLGAGAASTVTIPGNLTVTGTTTTVNTVTMNASNAIVFEGATADDFETTLTMVDPTADRTVTLPNLSGHVPLIAGAATANSIAVTAAEFALLDGGTVVGTTAVANNDAIVTNDAGTMRHTTVQTFQTYFDANSVGGTSIVTAGALNAGSIASGFGVIDNGTSGIRTATFTAETALLPDAVGGADLGSTSAEWGDIFIADDKAIHFGDGQDTKIEYDENGTDQLRIHAPAAGVVISGTTPKLTIGDADAEDTMLAFDGNAQDFRIGLDDGSDTLEFGVGTTHGTTAAIKILSNASVDIVTDLTVGNDLTLFSDDSILKFGADAEVTLTHVHNDGLLLNSTKQLQFGDSGTKINQPSDGVLDVVSDGTINLSVGAAGVIVKGTTPKVTIGDAGAEDTFLVFDGNAQDFRIGLDDGTDTLEFGVGAAHGTTTAITIDAGQQVAIKATTAAGAVGEGALVVDGGFSVAADIIVGDDMKLISDAAVLSFGVGSDVTFTHDNGTGLDLVSAGQLDISSTTAGITMTVVDGQTVTVGQSGASALLLSPHGTAGSELASLINTAGTTDGVDGAGAILLSSVAGGMSLAWADDKDLWAEGGQVMVVANHNIGDAIKLHADAGASQTITLACDEGTDVMAINLQAPAGGIKLNAGKDSPASIHLVGYGMIFDGGDQNDSMEFNNSPLALEAISAPSSTGGKLYNVGGSLYWNAIQLDIGSSTTQKQVFKITAAGGVAAGDALSGDSGATTFNISAIPKADRLKLIDIHVNGQLMLSGTVAERTSGAVDYHMVDDAAASTDLKFSFNLETDDVVQVVVR